VEVWPVGSEIVTLFRFRLPDQFHHRQTGSKEESACSARAPKAYRSVSVLENDWNYWNVWNVWNSLVVERMERLEQGFSQSNGWNHWNRLRKGERNEDNHHLILDPTPH
jgi:hypothetical protein